MRSLWLGILACAAMLVACGDDDSDFSTRPSDGSSSSVCKDCDDVSSSSSVMSSSSSVTLATPCKTETEDNCEYGSLTDDRDGQTYKTVKIGDQWWMAENLNYASLYSTQVLDSSSFCYKDSAEYCEKYGRLYIWSAAMDSTSDWGENGRYCGFNKTCSSKYPVRGICPEGWHLPSADEWKNLYTVAGGKPTAGTPLKSTNGWNNEGNGTDAFGFSALPAGYYDMPVSYKMVGEDGEFKYKDEGDAAYFWSSTEFDLLDADGLYLKHNNESVYLGLGRKSNAFSVRCIKD